METLTTTQVARQLQVSVWLVRETLDRLERAGQVVPRVGPYRAIGPELLKRVQAELEQRNARRQPASPSPSALTQSGAPTA